MLLIKDFSAQKGKLSWKEELVTLNDLAKTLCLKSKGASCEKFIGVDLLSDHLKSNDWIYLYVVRNASSNFKFDTHKAIRISRNVNFLESLKSNPSIKISE